MKYKSKIWILLQTTIFLLVFIILASITSESKIIEVNDDGGEDFQNIQDAVNNADEFDTIIVHDGEYFENIIISKPVNVIGYGSLNTTVEGQAEDHTITVNSDEVNISGFSVNNYIEGYASMYLSSVTMCNIHNNSFSTDGAVGIIVRRSNSNSIVNNSCKNNSIGIYLIDRDNNNNDLFHNNLSDNENGMWITKSEWNSIKFNAFHNNTGKTTSSGIWLRGSSNNRIIENSFISNTLGLYFESSSGIHCESNVVMNNTIMSNSDFGLNAQFNGEIIVNSRNNWWGDNSGPYHNIENPSGKGDNISDYVSFDPWIGKPNNFPSLEITSPNNNSLVNNTIRITGTSSDLDGNDTIMSIEVSINSSSWEVIDGTTEWVYVWNTSKYINGSYTISFRAFDGKNYSIEKMIILIVDNRIENFKPEIIITSHNNNSIVMGVEIIIGNATDMNGNDTITIIEISINGSKWQAIEGQESWSYEWDTNLYPNGDHEISFRAFDGELYSEVSVINLQVNNSQPNIIPVIEIFTPQNNTEVTTQITCSGITHDADGNESIEKVELSVENGPWQTINGTTTWSYEFNATGYISGAYSLSFRAWDGENYSVPATITVFLIISTEKCSIVISFPLNNTAVSGNVVIEGMVIRNGASVDFIEVNIDDGPWIKANGTDTWVFSWDTMNEENGPHTITARCFYSGEYSEIQSIQITVDNAPINGNGGNNGGYEMVIVIIILICVVGGVVVLIIRRK